MQLAALLAACLVLLCLTTWPISLSPYDTFLQISQCFSVYWQTDRAIATVKTNKSIRLQYIYYGIQWYSYECEWICQTMSLKFSMEHLSCACRSIDKGEHWRSVSVSIMNNIGVYRCIYFFMRLFCLLVSFVLSPFLQSTCLRRLEGLCSYPWGRST